MSKSILYAANTATQTVADGGSISFGSAVRRYGCNCAILGGIVALQGAGYYDIDASISFEATGTGTANISLFKDGAAITGATAVLEVVSGQTYNISIPCVVRNLCCKTSTINATISAASASIINASIVVRKE